uniref:Uncharacterized protein n=1 Tax=Anguilla anguilla TaxID=7936 RepID=A0A0E9TB18_ANGAN
MYIDGFLVCEIHVLSVATPQDHDVTDLSAGNVCDWQLMCPLVLFCFTEPKLDEVGP